MSLPYLWCRHNNIVKIKYEGHIITTYSGVEQYYTVKYRRAEYNKIVLFRVQLKKREYIKVECSTQ